MTRFHLLAVAALGAGAFTTAHAVQLHVTTTNLAGANGTVVAPLNVGFHSGVYDAFDIGSVATPEIQRVAELGSGALYLPAFQAADPTATVGTIGSAPSLPGTSVGATFDVDASINPYFSFAAMVVPSNDFFLGNDSPTAYKLFDGAGHLQLSSITVYARDLWDAGTEVWDPAAAAFVGDATLRADQDSVVAKNFAEFAAFDGLATAAGFTFESGMSAGTPVFRIDIAPVPEPASYALFAAGLLAIGFVARRRSRR